MPFCQVYVNFTELIHRQVARVKLGFDFYLLIVILNRFGRFEMSCQDQIWGWSLQYRSRRDGQKFRFGIRKSLLVTRIRIQ